MEPRHIPSLNLDVFRTILNHLPVADLKQVTVVSHTLYEEALREILVKGVRLRKHPTKLTAFCDFMLHRNPPLFQFLRGIDIDIDMENHSSDGFNPDDLLEVLSRATYISDLRIHWGNFSLTPDCDRRLQSTIIELKHLRRLQLQASTSKIAMGRHFAEIILNLRSQLDTLELLCLYSPFHSSQLFPRNIGEHQTHLRVLRISYPDLVRTPWVPLPFVRTLELVWPRNRLISLRHIAQTFPCLHELTVCLELIRSISMLVQRSSSHHRIKPRDDALALQRAGEGWKSLDFFATTGRICEAWVLGLACPVKSVQLGRYRVDDHAMFVDVLSGMRPKKIGIALECTGKCAHPDEEQSLFIFPMDGAVTHASMFVIVHPEARDAKLFDPVDQSTSGIIETVGSHVKRSRLEYLHVTIAAESIFRPEEYTNPEGKDYDRVIDSSPEVPCVLSPVFMRIDIEVLVSGLAAASSGYLRVIALTISARGQSVWMIEWNEIGHTITKVQNPQSARRIIDQEERSYMY